jgi:hypothetical protein
MRDHGSCLDSVLRRMRWHRGEFARKTGSEDRPYHAARLRRLEAVLDFLIARAPWDALETLMADRPELAPRVLRVALASEGLVGEAA